MTDIAHQQLEHLDNVGTVPVDRAFCATLIAVLWEVRHAV